jgi:hypothetical protein
MNKQIKNKRKRNQMIFKVYKKSGKPFKSGLWINTVKGETINPYTQQEAFIFQEDESVVDKHILLWITPINEN